MEGIIGLIGVFIGIAFQRFFSSFGKVIISLSVNDFTHSFLILATLRIYNLKEVPIFLNEPSFFTVREGKRIEIGETNNDETILVFNKFPKHPPLDDLIIEPKGKKKIVLNLSVKNEEQKFALEKGQKIYFSYKTETGKAKSKTFIL